MTLGEMKIISETDIDAFFAAERAGIEKEIYEIIARETARKLQLWLDAHDITHTSAISVMPENLKDYIRIDVDSIFSEFKANLEWTDRYVELIKQRL